MILKTSFFLDDLGIKPHFHANLMSYVIEFAFQAICLGRAQLEPFSGCLDMKTNISFYLNFFKLELELWLAILLQRIFRI